jgi:hypothetical protein
MTKLAAVIQVPFRSANQFLGEGGLQVRKLSALCPAVSGPRLPTHASTPHFRMYTMASGTRLVSLRINMPTLVVPLTAP